MSLTADDRLAIEQLIAEFAWRIDHDDPGGAADLFRTDAVLQAGKTLVEGREAIRGFMIRSQPPDAVTRHAATNIRLWRQTPEEVHGTVLILLTVRQPSGASLFGVDYRDTFVRAAEGGWWISRREIKVATSLTVA